MYKAGKLSQSRSLSTLAKQKLESRQGRTRLLPSVHSIKVERKEEYVGGAFLPYGATDWSDRDYRHVHIFKIILLYSCGGSTCSLLISGQGIPLLIALSGGVSLHVVSNKLILEAVIVLAMSG